MTDINRAKEIISSTGLLELKLVQQGPVSDKSQLMTNGQVPDGMEIVPGVGGAGDTGTEYYLVRRAAIVSGTDLRDARPTVDENNLPAVSFTLTGDAGRRFGDVTGANIGRSLAIVLDGRVQSAPRIDGRITTDGRITGSFTQQEAQDLSLILRSGSLPATLNYLEENTVGPSLGADSIREGFVASLVGLVLIVAFMLIYYRLSGVNAVVALLFNLIILLGLMAYMGAVMTLPGIAGLRADDGHRRGFERADLRAHQGRARGAAGRPRVAQCRLQPRFLDAGRHARRGGDHLRVPLPVRHGPDSRVRRDAGRRSHLESVHRGLRVEGAV